jgi:glycosyltransferase involved in cell wall biosynthesis
MNLPTPAARAELPDIVLDLSRLLARVLHSTPTGVDRVEMAYALGLLRLAPERLSFAVTHPFGVHGRVPKAAAEDFLALTAANWEREGLSDSRYRRWRRAVGACVTLAPLLWPRPARLANKKPRRAYLHLSARSLERTGMFRAILRAEGARFVPFVHDLIPLRYPEYARPQGSTLYARKLVTVTTLASGVLVNSMATAEALAPALARAGRSSVPIHVAPLGAPEDPPRDVGERSPHAKPYFVVLGTIEPRKNHILLLHIWRRFVETLGPAATPCLTLIGRRGWENEMVLDLLDRCPALKTVVKEHGRLSDSAQRALVVGARAVLLPSFAEGYGLPVVEALALGVPVIASDLPALRESGGSAPDYIDPLDAVSWAQAILDYAQPASPRRAAQLARLSRWTAPTWDGHIRLALDFIAEVCG